MDSHDFLIISHELQQIPSSSNSKIIPPGCCQLLFASCCQLRYFPFPQGKHKWGDIENLTGMYWDNWENSGNWEIMFYMANKPALFYPEPRSEADLLPWSPHSSPDPLRTGGAGVLGHLCALTDPANLGWRGDETMTQLVTHMITCVYIYIYTLWDM